VAALRWSDGRVTVRVPATSANLGPGFDALGLALSLHDVVRAQVTEAGLAIEVHGVGAADVPRGEDHLVVRAMRKAFKVLGGQPPGLALHCKNAIPHGFGLGSSAAAIVAGVLAARALAGAEHLSDDLVLQLAAELEGHADNVAACLHGGLTIAWGEPVRCARLEPLPGLATVLCVPAEPLATQAARVILPVIVPHTDAARNAARSALLIAALTSDPSLLLEGTEDFLHQPYRASSMPATARLVAVLRESGVAAVVSGAGPAVLALIPQERAADAAVAEIARQAGPGWTVSRLDVDRCGSITQSHLQSHRHAYSKGSRWGASTSRTTPPSTIQAVRGAGCLPQRPARSGCWPARPSWRPGRLWRAQTAT
jgi:homoserine kinase